MADNVPDINKLIDRIVEHSYEHNHMSGFDKPKSGTPVGVNNDPNALKQHVYNTLQDPQTKGIMAAEDGSKMYFRNERTNTFVVLDSNQPHGGTVFRSKTPAQGQNYFNKQAAEVGRELGKIPEVVEGGFDALAKHHMATKALLPKLGRALGTISEYAGKTLKVLGPLGVIGAGAEVLGLGERAHAAAEMGLIPEESLLEYDAILAMHTGQATVDPSLVGGEVGVQAAYDAWCDKYGIEDYIKAELEPSSLIEMVSGQMDFSRGDTTAPPDVHDLYESLPLEMDEQTMMENPEVCSLVECKQLMEGQPETSQQYQQAWGRFNDLYDEFSADDHGGIEHVCRFIEEQPGTPAATPVPEVAPGMVQDSSPVLTAPKL